MKLIQFVFYLIQVIIFYFMIRIPYFFSNKINFMRSVLYRSKLIETEYSYLMWLLSLVFIIIAMYLSYKLRSKNSYWLMIISFSMLLVLYIYNFQILQTFYLWILGIISLFVVQFILIIIRYMINGFNKEGK